MQKERKQETPEEKKARMEKHQEYMQYILRTRFRKQTGSIEGNEFYVCKDCKTNHDSEDQATQHYFANHWKKKNGNSKPAK